MAVWQSGGQTGLMDLLLDDAAVTDRLDPAAVRAMFDMDYHTKHVDTIFARVFPD